MKLPSPSELSVNLVAQFLIWHPRGPPSCSRQLVLYQSPFSVLSGYQSKMPPVYVYLEEKCLGIFSVLAGNLSHPQAILCVLGSTLPSTALGPDTLSKHRLAPAVTKWVPVCPLCGRSETPNKVSLARGIERGAGAGA